MNDTKTGGRLGELDLARVLAMLAVVAIHVTSTFIRHGSHFQLLGMNPAFILNQAARFAVPLFVFLSGVSLGLKEYRGGYLSFLGHRFRKIGIPYLIWSLIYIGYSCLVDHRPTDLPAALKSLLLGQAAPHLYFIIVIFQFYLLYPLLTRWVRRSPAGSLLLSLLVTFTVQMLFRLRELGTDLIPDGLKPYLWLLFPTWMFYFVAGLTLSRKRLDAVRQLAVSAPWPLLAFTAVYAFFYVVNSFLTNSLESIKAPLIPYVALVFLCSFALWDRLQKFRSFTRAVTFLSRHSMTLYFGHILVLNQLRHYPVLITGMSGMVLLLAGVLAISIPGAALVDTVLARLTPKKQK